MIFCLSCGQRGWGKRLLEVFLVFGVAVGSTGVLSGCGSLPLERSGDLEVQCRRDLQQASQLRGLPLKREVTIERETPEMLRTALAAELEKPENRDFLTHTEVLLRQLRVMKRDEVLKDLLLKMMGEQVAAYYDPAKKRVAYIEGASKAFTNSAALPLVDRFVYVHEFCHAVEDSHFDIERLTRESMADFDRNLALTSLVEGDAMLVGLDSVFAEAPMNTATPFGAFAVQVMGRMDLSGEMSSMGDGPAFLSGSLIRPYLDGSMFSNRIRRESGWKSVDSVFQRHLPVTTAEILYPERRFLHKFEPAVFQPDCALFCSAQAGVLTNRVGVLGMALWFGEDRLVCPRQYDGCLRGWMGDQVYFLKGAGGGVEDSVWLSYWERPGQAKAFCRLAEKRMSATFERTPWRVKRVGRLVSIVWSEGGDLERCDQLVSESLKSRVCAERPGAFLSWCSDLPLPGRFPSYEGYSSGFELLGGHIVDTAWGEQFLRFNLADGLILRAETNPDRCYWGTVAGLAKYVKDERSDYTCWRVPLLASWFRRGVGSSERYSWRVLGGLAACGSERQARVLLIPVWRSTSAP